MGFFDFVALGGFSHGQETDLYKTGNVQKLWQTPLTGS
jgi:hypothetical protein